MQQDDWMDFWFKPQLFIDQSWFNELDERLLNQNSSALAWHLSYGYVCDCFCLPKEYRELEGGLGKNILRDLLQNDQTILDLASMMVSSIAVNKSISVDIRRKILQRNRALSLKKRFLAPCSNLSEKEHGLFFLYLVIMVVAPELWCRVRLLFPRENVKNAEWAGKQVPYYEVNAKAIKRAWIEIFNLKQALRPKFFTSEADKTTVSIDDEAANDSSEQRERESDGRQQLAAVG